MLISPRGKRDGSVDRELAQQGRRRRIQCVVPHFSAAPYVVAASDCILTAPERIVRAFAPALGLRVLAPPLALPDFALRLYWHASAGADPANRWLRDFVLRVAGGSPAPAT